MVTQTVEAIYENGNIKLLWNIHSTKARLYIVVIEDVDAEIIPWSDMFIGTTLHKRGRNILSKVA
ncbi:MAG: hypothetical protein ACD_71C00012G0003 [uncultured bacterium (gcode 4)]|uniref:Uncharacterized protein n=1 Tax=uncultured bacterium (gcode 4) TaxID=1234023 RepID=K1YPA0_9BACT|nr:MAG: hypothetical protein ACD_71C00012G0003 [uncultured bacterium (gcode 4)]